MSSDLFPFEILEIPAAGAYATLCIARTAAGEVVACKVLKKDFVRNADPLTRMRDEARVLSRLKHEGIVKVIDLLNLDGRPVMVMEWVQGLDLARIIRTNPEGVPAPIACQIVLGAARALDAAYSSPVGEGGKPLNVIHRDIKPENIMLTVEGVVKVLDFGTAKGTFEDRESRTTAIVMGSRGFMAPERLDGDPDTVAVDIYALGMSFFQLLTGKPMVVSMHHDRHDPAVEKTLEHFNPDDLPRDVVVMVRQLVKRMCAYEAHDRPNYADVVDDIEAALAGVHPDLAAYASAHVRPIHDTRPRRAPEAHKDYEDLKFLGTAGSWDTLANPEVTEEQSDDALRRFLKKPGWEGRISDLQLLLADAGRWTPGPFIEVLNAAQTPWWQVWATRPTPTAIATALEFLKRRRSDREVINYAKQFADHEDERVREAAAVFLEDG